MKESKRRKALYILLIFSTHSTVECYSQNVANEILGIMLNEHYKYKAISYSGEPFGYDFNDYDSIFINSKITVADTKCRKDTYEK